MSKANDLDVAAWIRRRLRFKQWTQADLVRELNHVSSGRVSEWVRGIRTPSPESCERLADVLGDDVDYVLTLAGHRPPDYSNGNPEDKALCALLRQARLNDEQRGMVRLILEQYKDNNRKRASRPAES